VTAAPTTPYLRVDLDRLRRNVRSTAEWATTNRLARPHVKTHKSPEMTEARPRVVQLSEHHAAVDLTGAPLPRVGSQLDVVPNHCCAAVNLADDLWVEEHDVLRPWPVAARGRNG
jgi:D-serine deaminase-like pyridoxal phosphate-dependent protein